MQLSLVRHLSHAELTRLRREIAVLKHVSRSRQRSGGSFSRRMAIC